MRCTWQVPIGVLTLASVIVWCYRQDVTIIGYPMPLDRSYVKAEKTNLLGYQRIENSFGRNETIQNKIIRDRFETMKFNLLEACQSKSVYQVHPTLGSIKDRNLLYDYKHNFIYCMVEKIGSTFWRRVFHLLNHPEYTNLYSIPQFYVHKEELPTLRNFNIQNSTRIIGTAQKAMFVREPYARAFSGYVDKLYSMNYYYMQSLGRGIIKALRRNATAASLACGHDLTFTEFIRYLVSMQQRNLQNYVDVHFSQIYTHCLPCEVKYDYIGTMENFDEDASYLISEMNLSNNISVEISKRTSVTLSIYLVLNDTFSLRQKMAHCMPWRAMYTRAWRTLQIRGLINPQAPVPDSPDMTMDMLFHEAVKVSDPARVSEYKHRFLIGMYRTLDKQLLERFRQYVLPDCRLFGYDDRPSYLFDRI
ncbi:carbohydrate sulfotransferase 14-like [Mizuhopecten yessoensis]|nr:carbohydrate sulfotransferase 14-like [Mizuhopecten yessoensis]